MKCKVIARMIQATCLVITIVASASARIINVPAEYSTIQAGIDASVGGDTVLVAPGEYTEVFYMNGRNILLTSSHGPDATILSSSHCWINQNEDTTCIIRGFSFVESSPYLPYALISCIGNTSPIIEGNELSGNECSVGGAINANTNPIIRNNIIHDNYASGVGGAIAVGGSPYITDNATIKNNIIFNNRTGYTLHGEGMGGGIWLFGFGTISGNIIYRNSAIEGMNGGDGGGICRLQNVSFPVGKITIVNNTIIDNEANVGGDHGLGGGICLISYTYQDSVIFENNIVAFNTMGHNIYSWFVNSMYLKWDFNLVYPDTSGFMPGEHDIFSNPLFVDTSQNDYHLLSDSPCIDAGDPDFPLDPDSTSIDIGALFYDHRVDLSDPDAPTGPHNFSLYQNYPNPFNSETIISFYLAEAQAVNLRIFDITGRVVKRLIANEQMESGEHRIIWDGRDDSGKGVVTAIYFAELEVEGSKFVKSMILMR